MNTAVRSAFQRMGTEYRQPAGAPTGAAAGSGPGTASGYGAPAGSGFGAPGGYVAPGGYGAPGGYRQTAGYPPVPPVPSYMGPQRVFSAARAYDKLIVLCIMAIISAAFGYAVVPTGAAFACLGVAFAIVLVSWFRMRWARVLAPTYSILEGVGLGSISGAYATLGHGIVPLAIVFTAATFIGALVLYRTGLVRVTPRMMSLAFMGALGIMAVGALSLLGLSLPGVNSFGTFGLVFGIVALAIAVLNLFTDFAYITQAEQQQLSAEAEWAAAFAIMTALVLVYVSILRILASAYGRR
jgi:uncharacterized YccA/Bax inhibitor family protein